MSTEKETNPFFTPVKYDVSGLKMEEPVFSAPETSQSTPAFKPGALSNAKVGRLYYSEPLPKTVETKPFAFKEAVEQKARADSLGQEIKTTLDPIKPSISATQQYIPVGIEIKLPFIQRGFTIPDDTIGYITKDLIQSPEKIIKSAIYNTWTDDQKEAFKIKEESKILESPLYQKDYKELVDNGVNPVGAFVLTGISAAVDASLFSDFIAKPILKTISKIPVSREVVESLTWKDLSDITRGKVLSNEKMAAFNKLSNEGVDWAKALKKGGNKIEINVSGGETLGQWIKKQGYQPGLSIKDVTKKGEADAIAKRFNPQERQVMEAFIDSARGVSKLPKKERLDLEFKAQSLAENFRLEEATATNKKLANKFDELLQSQRQEFKQLTKETPTITDSIAKAKAGGKSFDSIVKQISKAETGKPIIIKGYHGTPDARFLEEFDPTKKGYFKDAPELLPDMREWEKMYGKPGQGFKTDSGVYRGISFTDDYNVAKSYSEKPAFDFQNSVPMVVERNITLENPKVIDVTGKGMTKNWDISFEDLVEQARKEGHDGVIFRGIKDNYHPQTTIKPSNNVVIFDDTKIKTKSQLKQLWDKTGKEEAFGAVAGVEVDEEGNLNISPEKAVMGVLGVNAISKGQKQFLKDIQKDIKKKITKKTPVIKEKIKGKKRIEKIKTSKDILNRRRGFVKAVQKQFGLSDNDIKKITGRDIRLMNNIEFKQFLNDLRKKADKLSDKYQVRNELIEQIKEKNLDIEPLRKAMKFPSIANMTTEQLRQFDKVLEPYQKDDVFLSKRKLETVNRTELEGIRTYREAKEILAKKIGVNPNDLGNITISEFDRFRGDTALAQRNPFFKMMVEETAKLQFIRDAEFLEIEKKVNDLASKIGGRFQLIPRQKNIAKWFDAEDKATVQLTKEEAELVQYMQEEWSKARDYLIQIEAMKKGINADNYYTHVRRGILEAVVEDGVAKAAKEAFKSYKLDEQTFNILDGQTGEIMALDKFFRFALKRTGELVPTKNIVRAFRDYMKTFKKKQALDEIVPLIDIYAYTLSPKGTTKEGVLLHGNLINFTKEWLNTKKGRVVNLVAKQGGKIDLTLRGLKTFTSLLDIGLNIPVSIATQVGEQAITYKLLGKKNYLKSKALALTPKGKRITKKYRNFIGKNPWAELIEPAKGLGERLSAGIFVFFQDANVRRSRNFLLGKLTKEEWATETISAKRLSELRIEMGRYGVIPGAKSIYGATSVGGAWTQYKTWALPILRSELQSVWQLKSIFTKNKKPGAEAFLNLYRTLEMVALVSIVGSLIGDNEDCENMTCKIKQRAYQEMSTVWQALDPKLFLSAGRIASFLEDLGMNLSSIIKLEEYEQGKFGKYGEGDLKGLNRLIKQLTPRAIKQFEKEIEKTPEDIKQEIKEDIARGRLSVSAAKEKYLDEMKKLETKYKKELFGLDVEEYKKALKERILNEEITIADGKKEFMEYTEKNKEKIQEEISNADEETFVSKLLLHAKAIGIDPITTFNFIFSGEKIRRIDNGTIIIERMPWEESREIRKERGATSDLILDHTLPLQLGGSNSEDNLKLVTKKDWERYTIIENILGDKLRAGEITKKEAQQLVKDYKNGEINEEEIINK